MRIQFLPLLVFATGCTTLGPMPATTAQPFVPTPRPGLEVSGAAVPGYYLSSSVQENGEGAVIQQGSVMVEPGDLIGVPGLSGGARYVGKPDEGGYFEPMLRYRHELDDKGVFAAGVVAYGTHASGESMHASYEATRGGAEVGIDALATPESQWVELHFAASASLTGLDAKGDYCLDANGRWAVDCAEPLDNLVHASASGFYPAANGAIALDFARHLNGVLHGARIAALGSVGKMPHLQGGEQIGPKTYTAAGLSLTLGLGAQK